MLLSSGTGRKDPGFHDFDTRVARDKAPDRKSLVMYSNPLLGSAESLRASCYGTLRIPLRPAAATPSDMPRSAWPPLDRDSRASPTGEWHQTMLPDIGGSIRGIVLPARSARHLASSAFFHVHPLRL